ncbi:hypothetical protein M885DRAFT_417937, partial [Pelagophyceae sp. CCMP2097]
LFVRNLPFETSEITLRQTFEAVTRVRNVQIPTDAAGRPRGFAYVTLYAEDCEAAVLAMDGFTLGGRRLRVERSSP